jgi:hypothetical protein
MHLSLDLHLSIQFTDISLEIGIFGFKTSNFGLSLVDDGSKVLRIFDAWMSFKLGPQERFFALTAFDLYIWAVIPQMLNNCFLRREF